MPATKELMIDIEGKTLTPEDKELIQHPFVGGIILFERNYENIAQLQDLTSEIHSLSDENFIIAVDHEGGRVQRFHKGFTELPAMSELGLLYDLTPALATEKAEFIGQTIGKELKLVGIDYVFGPVLDINANISDVIGDRSFHSDPKIISMLTATLLQGIQSAGLKAVGKHFPGHGHVKADSHIDLPVDSRTIQEISSCDLLPFQFLINIGLDAVMPAHVVYDKCDSLPATFSSYWLQKILRGQLNFRGKIFSDDLSMKGASVVGDMKTRLAKAKEAGCDMSLICNDRPIVRELLLS
jgi:beta-N-acetylhexosaminidase